MPLTSHVRDRRGIELRREIPLRGRGRRIPGWFPQRRSWLI
jgi:hypothetical protein